METISLVEAVEILAILSKSNIEKSPEKDKNQDQTTVTKANPKKTHKERVKKLDGKIKSMEYQGKIELLKLENDLKKLEEIHGTLSKYHAPSEKLNNVKLRITEAKRVIIHRKNK